MAERAETTYNEKEKIWHGKKEKTQYVDESSLGSLIFNSLQQHPDRIGQICHNSGKHLTNAEISLLSIRVAQHLEDLNLKQGEIIGICAVNSDYLACLVFGCLFRGLVISTLDPSFDKDGIKHTYSITKPKIMFCDGAIYEILKEAFEECELYDAEIYTIDNYKEGVPKLTDLLTETQREEEFKCINLKWGPNQLAFILCSSGTTGLPKGVCLTHLAFLNQLSGLPTNKSECGLCFSTLYWISGVIVLLLGTVQNFTRVISSEPYSPENFIEIVKKYQITLFLGPPSQIGLLISCPKLQQNDLASLKLVYLGGSAVPYSIVKKLQSYAPKVTIVIGYGQTEICASVAVGTAKEDGNCGQLVPNVEVKIIDDNNKNLGPNEVGEICSRSICEWPGYYGNPEATANTYDSEKWIHSGDLGYFNVKGDLFVIDRKKDILKYNNYHFYPTEIEAVILELNDVIEVCVFGIPDLIFTNLPAAAIVKKPGSKLTSEEVYQHVYQRMAHFKYLRGGVCFVNILPKTASGKILRRKVVQLYKDYKQE